MKVTHSLLFATLLSTPTLSFASKPLSFKDVFDFKQTNNTLLSDDGQLLATSAKPYRGDPTGLVYQLDTNALLASVPLGSKPVINKSATWVAFTQEADLLKTETTKKADRKKLKKNLVLVNAKTGEQSEFTDVKDYQLSDDGLWLAYRKDVEKKKETAKEASQERDKDDNAIKADKKDTLLPLILVSLSDLKEVTFDSVNSYAISNFGLIWQVGSDDGKDNRISFRNFQENEAVNLLSEPGITVSTFSWHPTKALVAFSEGNYVNEDSRRRDYHIRLWDADKTQLSTIPNQDGWFSAKTAKLQWSEKGERLYFGNSPFLAAKAPELKYKDTNSLTDFDTIRAQKGLKVWHPNDAEIKPREINQWNKENKHKQYQAVYHLASDKVVQLTTPSLPNLTLNTEATTLLANDDSAYLSQITYNGFYSDYYSLDISTGKSQMVVKKSRFVPSVSPAGHFAVYFNEGEYWFKDLPSQQVKPLTRAVQNALFADDEHDYPSEQPGQGIAGWNLDESQVLVYSKYDIWSFDTKTLRATPLTQGKPTDTMYRVVKLDKQWQGYSSTDTLLLQTYNLKTKESGIATLNLETKKVTQVLDGEARFDLIAKAKQHDKLIFTKQSYQEFPDLWQTTSTFKKSQKVTALNPQLNDFAWGEKPELVQYKGYDGEDLQGVLIKPAGYQAGQKVPVVIYFYRYMTQRRYDFPKMELNHRPNLPMFTSNGYAVFLPDIRFEIGHPGKSATKTMMNAAQKLIDIGVADPNNIGLQGHSWAGYQSAFMITQTNMFKAVVSGAPVSNMTSAYSGIRLGSGLARQFQYETGQSRIGKALYEAPELYIENSPVFFADKVETPILIMFGNKDDAVPYNEGVQYYLALRRAGKDAIFLEYEDEPHHLKKFPNQVDFSIRMMEYFDHHLKGKPAPEWMQKGIPFIEE